MSIEDEQKRSIKMKLKPHECVIRFCTICGERMIPHFDYDTEYRWYIFQCKECKTEVSLGEMINLEYREDTKDDEYELEPLSEEEIEHMIEIEKKREENKTKKN